MMFNLQSLYWYCETTLKKLMVPAWSIVTVMSASKWRLGNVVINILTVTLPKTCQQRVKLLFIPKRL